MSSELTEFGCVCLGPGLLVSKRITLWPAFHVTTGKWVMYRVPEYSRTLWHVSNALEFEIQNVPSKKLHLVKNLHIDLWAKSSQRRSTNLIENMQPVQESLCDGHK